MVQGVGAGVASWVDLAGGWVPGDEADLVALDLGGCGEASQAER